MTEKIVSMKFGGTSVATAERRQMIVDHVRREIGAGYRVALVVSAMGRRGDPYATDTLLDLMRNMGGVVEPRNYSFLFVTGEMLSAGVMTHTLQLAGLDAVSLTGGQAGILTEDFHMSADVVKLDNTFLKKYVEQGKIPVVTGGQGVTQTAGDFSILGRGGSDTSGVLVAMMLDGERADIYTDVEYMLAIDPRVVADAPKREVISFKAAFEMARFGAKVIHPRAVKLGMQNNMPIRVRSTFSQSPGTLICEHVDTTPLVGFSVVPNAQVAELTGQQLDQKQLDSLEQHVGLLSLADQQTGKQILCAPSNDTASEVDKELKNIGITSVAWQQGYSLVSVIGTSQAQPEIDSKARQVLSDNRIAVKYHELLDNRSTYVVSEGASKQALETLYRNLKSYLD